MRNIILVCVCSIVIVSCDTRKDFNDELNLPPDVKLRKSNTQNSFVNALTDSVKQSFCNYTIEYLTKDEEKLAINVEMPGVNDVYTINGGSIEFTPKSSEIGPHLINLSQIDSYRKKGMATATIIVFYNLIPVANLVVTKTAIYDPLEYNISGALSYDRDSKFGGTIKQYEFSINNSYKVTTPLNNINYIFSSTGNYTISIRVQDSDGDWSNYKTLIVNVQ